MYNYSTNTSSALVIVDPLPKVTYLTPGEDENMTISISGSIFSEDDVTFSLGHSLNGVYKDITEYLVYEISKEDEMAQEDEMDQDESNLWIIDMILPYPFSQASGDLILSVGDDHSGDVTTTRLITLEEGTEVSPFFDPEPKSVKNYPGQDVLINTRAMGSTPINVSFDYCLGFYI